MGSSDKNFAENGAIDKAVCAANLTRETKKKVDQAASNALALVGMEIKRKGKIVDL